MRVYVAIEQEMNADPFMLLRIKPHNPGETTFLSRMTHNGESIPFTDDQLRVFRNAGMQFSAVEGSVWFVEVPASL